MPDTGYSLHSRRVRGSNGSLSHRFGMFDGRFIVLAVILVLVVVVLISGIASCVRNANSTETENTKQMSTADSRVAAGVSDSMVSEFSTQLDRNEKLAQIAANADQYDDDRLLQLALDEPAAISFVAGYPTAEKTTSGYNQSVSIGNPPLLYDWNTAWGYAEYDDGCIAVTGSEPTTLSMAYMGLTGNTDQTPVGTARALNSAASSASSSTSSSTSTDGTTASDSSNSTSTSTTSTNTTTGNTSSTTSSTSSTDADIFCTAATNLGLTPTVLSVSSDSTGEDTTSSSTVGSNLTAALKEGALVAVKLKSQTLTDDEHWALVVNANADGSVSVYDPTSSSVSSHTWGAGTIAASASEMISLTATKSSQNNASDATSSSSAGTTDSSTTGTSGTSTSANSTSSTTGSTSTGNGSTATGSSSSTGTGTTSSTGTGTSGAGTGSTTSNG